MKVGVLTSLYPSPVHPREGAFAAERWSRMARRGHFVRLARPVPWWPLPFGPKAWRETRDEPSAEISRGVEIVRPRYLHLPGRARANARRFAAAGLRALLAEGLPDVVVADYAWPAAEAAHECRRRSIPFVVHGRGSDVLQVAGEAGLHAELGAAVKTAGHWCAVSRQLVDALDALAGARRGRLVPNGVDAAVYAPAAQDAARAALGLPAQGRIVLVVGHWIERKDPLLALEAAALLAQDELARIVLVGRGPLEGAIARRAARSDLAGRVQLVPECPPGRLADWYNAADALLLCSNREGRPNVVLEALACGLPVVASDAGGTGELLGPAAVAEHPDAAAATRLVRGRAAQDYAQALRAVLAAPRNGAALRGLVATLDWDASCAALEAVLREATGAQEPAR